MADVSIVLGIISIVFAFILSIVALVLNVKKQEAKGISIAVVALNGYALAVIIYWFYKLTHIRIIK